jgi:hypothetical protein
MKEERDAFPWDLLSLNTEYVSEETYSKRYKTCKSCEEYVKYVGVCKQCGCVMKIKCAIEHAKCPKNKWEE